MEKGGELRLSSFAFAFFGFFDVPEGPRPTHPQSAHMNGAPGDMNEAPDRKGIVPAYAFCENLGVDVHIRECVFVLSAPVDEQGAVFKKHGAMSWIASEVLHLARIGK